MDAKEKRIRRQLRDDFRRYAKKCLKIRAKSGAVELLVLNQAQEFIHGRLETQLAETGKVRALILKGRQQGASTYVEGRFYWKVTHRQGVRAFILTHVDDATANLFGMAKRYHEHCPDLVKPSTAASNAKELIFDRLDSGYKVSTAGSKGAGRSSTLQYFHGSEVAYWPNAETHVAGALQAVPDAPGTEVILESTSDGPRGLFYEMCKAALAGQGEYQLIFVPWYWQAEYRKPVNDAFEATSEERDYAARYGLSDEQIAWRRAKIVELNGVENFRREYPADVEEAFTSDAQGALWQRDNIKNHRVAEAPELARIVVAIDPSTTANKNSDEAGIIAGGLGADGRGYILSDDSIKAHPAVWAARAVNRYHDLKADRIVAENNNGGEMVELTIHTVDDKVPVKMVWASRGKLTRAEPVAALYQQGKVSHVGHFSALEDEQCTWVPGKPSPNRMDALVWLLTELMLGDHSAPVVESDSVSLAHLINPAPRNGPGAQDGFNPFLGR